MSISTIIIDIIKVITFIWYLLIFARAKSYHLGIAFFMAFSMLPGMAVCSSALILFVYRFIIGVVYIRIISKHEFLRITAVVLLLFLLAEVIDQVVAAGDYLSIVLPDLIAIMLQVALSILIGWVLTRKIIIFFYYMQKRIQIGIILISSSFAFITPQMSKIIFIIINFLILFLWIMDQLDEKKKIRELTSYSHRTREIIPSMRRALERTDLDADHLLEELRSVCDAEQRESTQEFRSLKDFDSTGVILLDEQLKRYLEEAWQEQFELDIIVMAPINQLITSQKIERLHLLQVVGDMYRNAYRAISKAANGRILICFGFNLKDEYEITFYDNGELFKDYILANLGLRGTTSGGIGHGIADTLKVLEKVDASFVIDQVLTEHSTFTKGVKIIFDGLERLEIIRH